jgi:DNA-binding Lrp family transcriptional regulator
MTKNSTDHDAQIFKAIQTDSRQTDKKIGDKVGVVPSTVNKLIHKHLADGSLKYKAVLDPAAFDLRTLAFVQFKLHNKLAEIADKTVAHIEQYKNVQEIHHINGKFDILVKIRCRDPVCVHDFIQAMLHHGNVADSQTIFSMKIVHETTDIDTSAPPPKDTGATVSTLERPRALKSANEA